MRYFATRFLAASKFEIVTFDPNCACVGNEKNSNLLFHAFIIQFGPDIMA